MTIITDLAAKLCSWERECDCRSIPNIGCSTCHSTGFVYVLDDSVRVPCDINSHAVIYQKHSGKILGRMLCLAAGCPGWTPSTDLAVWWKAVPSWWLMSMETGDGTHHTIVSIYEPSIKAEFTEGSTEPLDALILTLAQVMEKEANV